MHRRSRRESDKCDAFSEKFVSFDRFGQKFEMAIDEGRGTLKSGVGAGCSVVIRMLILAFAVYKVIVMETKKSVDVLQVLKTDAVDQEAVFTDKQGFNLAVAVLGSYNENEAVDPAYGWIRFRRSSWSLQGETGEY